MVLSINLIQMIQLELPLGHYETLNVKGMPRFIPKSEYDQINLDEHNRCGTFPTLLCHIYNTQNGTFYSVKEYLEIDPIIKRERKERKTLTGIIESARTFIKTNF